MLIKKKSGSILIWAFSNHCIRFGNYALEPELEKTGSLFIPIVML